MENQKQPPAADILDECKQVMIKKSNDYQNPFSRIKQADYYPRGVATILDIMQAKILRMYSVIEAMENDPNYTPNFESFEDSCKDLINYSSFAAAYSRGLIAGQDPMKDFLNRKRPVQNIDVSNMSESKATKVLKKVSKSYWAKGWTEDNSKDK